MRPYLGLLALAVFCGVLRFLLPATLAISQRFVIDELVPRAGAGAEHTDFSYRATISYLEWASTFLPAHWGTTTPWGQLNLLMATLVVVYALWGVTAYLRLYLAQLVGHRVILDLRSDLYQHITRLSHSFFQFNQSGGIVSRLMSDIALAQNFVGSAMTTIWMDLAACGFYLCLLFSMDMPLALASLCVFPFYIASMRTFGRAAKRTTKEAQASARRLFRRRAGARGGHWRGEKFRRRGAAKRAAFFTARAAFTNSLCAACAFRRSPTR